LITFENWEIRAFGGLAHQYDNLSRRLEVLGDLPQGWDWTMLVQVDDHMDLIPLSPMEGGIGADLNREQLALAGIYELQLRGSQGDRVRHSNTEYVQVFHSLSGDSRWPEIPTQFTQLEQRIQEANSHPPVPGENGFWLVWDVENGAYEESSYPLPSGDGTGTVGEDGGYYIPSVDADTGLLTFTPSKKEMPAVAAANVRGPAGADGKDGAGLDVSGASVGQVIRIAAVDENGTPIAWEPADLPQDNSSEVWCDDSLASGTLIANNAVLYDTGITLDKLREYKTFSYRLKGTSNTDLSNLYLRLAENAQEAAGDGNPVSIDRNGKGGRIVYYQWADGNKNIIRPLGGFCGNPSMVDLGPTALKDKQSYVLYTSGAVSILNFIDVSERAATDKLFLSCANTPTVDYYFEIRGMTK